MTVLLAAAEVSDPNAAALYAAVSAVLVALIGAGVAVLTTRNRQSRLPQMDENSTTHALPRELAEMLADTMIERDVWKYRAVRLGWTEDGDQ